MSDILIGLIKLVSLFVTAAAGILSVFSDFKDTRGKLTRKGRFAIWTVAVSSSLGLVLQGLETVRDVRKEAADDRITQETIEKQNELLRTATMNLDRQTVVLEHTDSIQAQTRATLSVQKTVVNQLSRATELSERAVQGQIALAEKSSRLEVDLTQTLAQTRDLIRDQRELHALSQRAFHPLGDPEFSFQWSFAIDSIVWNRLLETAKKVANLEVGAYRRAGFMWAGVAPESAAVRQYYNPATGVVLYSYGPESPSPPNFLAISFDNPSSIDRRNPRRPRRPRTTRQELEDWVEQGGGIQLDNIGFEVSLWRDSSGVLALLSDSTMANDDADLVFVASVDSIHRAERSIIDFSSGRVTLESPRSIKGKRYRDNRKVASTLDLVGAFVVVEPNGYGSDGLGDLQLEYVQMNVPGMGRLYLNHKFKRVDLANGRFIFTHVLTESELSRGW